VRILCRRRGRPSRIGKLTAKLTTGGDDVSKLLPVLSADYELGLLAASDLQRPAGRLGRGGPSGRFRRSESAIYLPLSLLTAYARIPRALARSMTGGAAREMRELSLLSVA